MYMLENVIPPNAQPLSLVGAVQTSTCIRAAVSPSRARRWCVVCSHTEERGLCSNCH